MTASAELPVVSLRPADLGSGDGEWTADRKFVTRSWVECMRREAFSQWVRSDVYYPGMRKLVARILSRSRTAMAVSSDDTSLLIGCVVHDSVHVHWLYVNSLYRGAGIGRCLLRAAAPALRATFATRELFGRELLPMPRDSVSVAARYNVIHDPFALYTMMGDQDAPR